MAADFAQWSPYNYVFGNPLIFTDPDGRAPENIIIENCDCERTERFVNIINENLGGQFEAYTEGYGENSVRLRLRATEGGGDLSKLSKGQQAFYSAINQPAEKSSENMFLELVDGDSKVHTGSFREGKIDLADVEQWPMLDPNVGSQDGPTQAGKVAHEVWEQFVKQIVLEKPHPSFDNDGYGRADAAAIGVEDGVNGNERKGYTYKKPDGTKHIFKVGAPGVKGVITVSKKKIE